MPYPTVPDYYKLASELQLYAQLKHERGAKGIAAALGKAEKALREALAKVQGLKEDAKTSAAEPDDLAGIQALRPVGPRRIWKKVPATFKKRLEGALIARFAGCTLGAPVEGWSVERMEKWAATTGDPFPPADYWTEVNEPRRIRYTRSACSEYTRDQMDGVPVDDDICYTQLGLLVLERRGLDFTTADIARMWVELLPIAWTAERVAIDNLKKGMPAEKAAEVDNPYVEWIGADIRADPWGYLAPGWPAQAAEMAYRDAYVSHRRNGIYGEMFFAAAVAAAFTVDDALKAVEMGLAEIPRDCRLAEDVRWALAHCRRVSNYKQGRAMVDERFAGMHHVHTNNNACLSIFGLAIGGRDVGKVIGETVAMGMDNDCTAATAGSIAGAVVGSDGIDPKWSRRFNNKVKSYMTGVPDFAFDDLVRRFVAQARRVHARG